MTFIFILYFNLLLLLSIIFKDLIQKNTKYRINHIASVTKIFELKKYIYFSSIIYETPLSVNKLQND